MDTYIRHKDKIFGTMAYRMFSNQTPEEVKEQMAVFSTEPYEEISKEEYDKAIADAQADREAKIEEKLKGL